LEFLPAPERPESPDGEVHVWRADLDGEIWPGAEALPAAERERAQRFLRALPRRRWVASRWALRLVLARHLGQEPAAIGLARGEHGKPRLALEPERLEFNLSHSEGIALVAVSRGRAVGVDVERVGAERDPLALAERALDPEDAAAVRSARPERRAAVFHERWARHEARLKCLGTGLGAAREEAPVAVARLELGPGYAGAVAIAGDELPPLRCWTLAPPRQRDV
jgi:4'-phosphopantetheinyl transferase